MPVGLMYLFPTVENESERITIDLEKQSVTLKSYGLPWIFWGYLAAALVVVMAMYLAIKDPIEKLKMGEDLINIKLAYIVEWSLYLTPIVLLGFFFYEKIIVKNKLQIKITHKVFFIPFFSTTLKLDSNDDLLVQHFMTSPNVAKMQNRPELKGFENRGYFELRALINNKSCLVDRHSRKQDLIKIKEILSKV